MLKRLYVPSAPNWGGPGWYTDGSNTEFISGLADFMQLADNCRKAAEPIYKVGDRCCYCGKPCTIMSINWDREWFYRVLVDGESLPVNATNWTLSPLGHVTSEKPPSMRLDSIEASLVAILALLGAK